MKAATVSRAVIAIVASFVLLELGVGSAAAVPGPPHTVAVPPGIGTGRVMVLRPGKVDLFNGGRFRRTIYLNGQSATLSGLAAAIGDPAFMSRPKDGTLRVSAALLQRPNTSLAVGGAGLRIVELNSDRGSPAFIAGTSAAVAFTGVTVTGSARVARAQRPYVSYGGTSVVTATSSRFTHLGRAGSRPIAALQIGRGAMLTASNVSFTDDVVGLSAANSAAVQLTSVTAARSSQDGIVLRNAGRVSAGKVTVSGNGRDGLILAGAGTQLTVTGRLSATENKRFGIMVSSAAATALSDARTHGNGVAGVNVHDAGVTSVRGLVSAYEPVALHVDSAAKFTADGVTAAGNRIGISATEKSRNVQLRSIIVTGARTGVRIDGAGVTADDVTVTGSGIGMQITSTSQNAKITRLTVTNPATSDPATAGAEVFGTGATLANSRIVGTRNGVEVIGSRTTIEGGRISATGTGVAVRDRADGTTVSGATITGGAFGVTQTATGRLALIRDEISDSGQAALRLVGGSTTVTSSTLNSLGTAIDAHAPVNVISSTVTGAVGARVAAGVFARFSGDQVDGSRTGIRVVKGGRVSVVSTNVTGHTPISGIATVTGISFIGPLPLHWFGAAGLALLVIALLLIALSRSRERGHERFVLAPAHVTNTA